MSPSDELFERLPLVMGAITRASDLREADLERYGGGARLKGLEESFDHIDTVRAILGRISELEPIAFLIDRARTDVEVGLYAALSGYPYVTADAMRDLMEIEFLLWDFSLDPKRISLWLHADDKTLRKEFAPAAVRTRLKESGAWNVGSKGESLDYKAHSAGLHVTPEQPIFKHRFEEDELMRDAAFWELFEHLRRLFETFVLMRTAFPSEAWARMKALDELIYARNAWARTRQMQDAFIATWTSGIEGLKKYVESMRDDPERYPGWLSGADS